MSKSIKDKDYVGDLRHYICKAPIIELAIYAYNSLLSSNRDSENDVAMKHEWSTLVILIFDAVDALYKKKQQIEDDYDAGRKTDPKSKSTSEKQQNFELIDYALCGPWSYSYPWKLTFRKVRRGRYTILLMKKLIERLRDAHRWVDDGGKTGKDWNFQRDLSNEFADIIKLLGRYTFASIQKTEVDKYGQERTRTIRYKVEPIITEMEKIRDNYRPPQEDVTSTSPKKILSRPSDEENENVTSTPPKKTLSRPSDEENESVESHE